MSSPKINIFEPLRIAHYYNDQPKNSGPFINKRAHVLSVNNLPKYSSAQLIGKIAGFGSEGTCIFFTENLVNKSTSSCNNHSVWFYSDQRNTYPHYTAIRSRIEDPKVIENLKNQLTSPPSQKNESIISATVSQSELDAVQSDITKNGFKLFKSKKFTVNNDQGKAENLYNIFLVHVEPKSNVSFFKKVEWRIFEDKEPQMFAIERRAIWKGGAVIGAIAASLAIIALIVAAAFGLLRRS